MITFRNLGHSGQLGNQLFQYALLLGVSANTGFEIAIPKRYEGIKKHGLVELSPFQITAKTLISSGPHQHFNRYAEKSFGFDPAVFEQPDTTDYEGYFQSERYFIHAEDWVRQEFRLNSAIERYAASLVHEQRRSGDIVALHVRRGDYLSEPEIHHVLSPAYYERAINHPALPLDRQFFVFSDDIDWCKQNIGPLIESQTTFVSSPSHWHDLAIMTYCDAHIIAASSFSWWGAWLCRNRPNVVIAPTPWFPETNDKGWDWSDVIPERWHKVNA